MIAQTDRFTLHKDIASAVTVYMKLFDESNLTQIDSEIFTVYKPLALLILLMNDQFKDKLFQITL